MKLTDQEIDQIVAAYKSGRDVVLAIEFYTWLKGLK
jgi:hypothetical protein